MKVVSKEKDGKSSNFANQSMFVSSPSINGKNINNLPYFLMAFYFFDSYD